MRERQFGCSGTDHLLALEQHVAVMMLRLGGLDTVRLINTDYICVARQQCVVAKD